MKNISLALNIVLLIAVGVLYYLHFSAGTPATPSEQKERTAAVGDLKIAYVSSDSLIKNYEFINDTRKKLEDKSVKLNNEYRNRAQGLQTEFNNYQRNVNSMTLSQVRAVEEDLAKKEQNLRMYEQTLAQELANEEAKIQKELYDRVTAFLKEYGDANGLNIVLKYDPTSDVLFAGDALDITQDVINGLNDGYKKEKAPAAGSKETPAKK